MLRAPGAILLLTILAAASPVHANPKPGGLWLMEFMQEAKGRGVSPQLLDRVFTGYYPDEDVVRLDRKQPEGTLTFTDYISRVVPSSRVREGREKYAIYKLMLEKVGRHYGVEPRYIVALWGIETNYGENMGSFNVPHALATLAYDGRRAEFFRDELHTSLQILQEGHIAPEAMQGSWAGAMGQSQFMPSSFLNFAVDANGDGHRDIWNTQEDVFASIANYLSKSGWNGAQSWGRMVTVPAGLNISDDTKDMRPLAEWKALGVRQADGSPLPDADIQAALIYPGEPHEGAYLVYPNYHVILKWNRSRYFATAVGTLADRIETNEYAAK